MTRRTSLYLRLALLGTTVAAFLAAGIVPQPLKAVLIVFGLVVGAAWIVGLFISNGLRREAIRTAGDDNRRRSG